LTTRRILIPLGILTAVILFALAGSFFLLPVYLESRLPRIAAGLGISDLRGEVGRPGLGSLHIRGLAAGPRGKPGLSMKTLQLDYSLAGLLNQRLDLIEISGLRLSVEEKEGKWTIPGLEGLFRQWEKNAGGPPAVFAAPSEASRIKSEEISGRLPAIPTRAIVIRHSTLVVKDGEAEWLLPFELSLAAAGEGLWRGEAKIHLQGEPVMLKAEADLHSGEMEVGVQSGNLDLSALAAAPFFPGGQLARGHLDLEASARLTLFPFALTEIETRGLFSEAVVNLQKGSLRMTEPSFRLAGTGRDQGLDFLYEISAAAGGYAGDDLQVEATALQASGSGHIDREGLSSAALALRASVVAANGTGRLTAPDAGIDGRISRQEGELNLAAEARLAGARLELPAITASGITAVLPFSWPATAAAEGRLTADSLRWRNQEMGTLAGACRQQGKDFLIDAIHRNLQLAGMEVHLAGRAGLEGDSLLDLLLTVPPFEARGVDLGLFAPAAAGMKMGGRIEASGRLTADPLKAGGSLQARWRNGSLRSKALSFSMEGIETELTLTDLFGLQSAPAQRLQFARATFGRLTSGEGSAEYLVENPGSLIFENSKFNWSGGQVRMEGLKLPPEAGEHSLVLHGDDLRIADILQQLGLAEAEGRGAVSGMIPLRVKNGTIRFGEGFLHSAPGSGGILRIREAHRLASGIPASAAQYSQVDFALEALGNFEYNWVRFLVESENEDLMLQLQLDGRPAEPLPFAFRHDLGTVVRLEGQGEAGITHPVRLDINFRLPLDELLRYGSGIHKAMEQIQ
jgi:hypothetical protein